MSVNLSAIVPPQINTDRAVLEIYNGTEEQVQSILATRNNPVIYAQAGNREVYNKEQLDERHAATRLFPEAIRIPGQQVIIDVATVYVIRLREGHARIGFVALYQCDEFPEMGWAILPAYMGKGYATEAARAVYDMAGTSLGIKDMAMLIREDNVASWKIAEKLGLVAKGLRKQEDGFTCKLYTRPETIVDDTALVE